MKKSKILFFANLLFFLFNTVNLEILDYKNEENWGQVCKIGVAQSPIDLPTESELYTQSDEIRITTQYPRFDNLARTGGHMVHSFGFKISGGSVLLCKFGFTYKYDIDNVHFHWIGEHTNGDNKPILEMHIVHTKNKDYISSLNDPDPTHTYLVLGFRFQLDETTTSPFIDAVIANKALSNISLDFNTIINMNSGFYFYAGGLTTPPCTEAVHFAIFKNFFPISRTQLNYFANDWIGLTYPKGNSRKIQLRNNRVVFYITGETNGHGKIKEKRKEKLYFRRKIKSRPSKVRIHS